ncbi:MAG: helix-turn-helix transcriptional regulator [Betaproteobacteria bacterium]|nr:helix-turn-helix transcriptional regulator [Betaproteobacteria bacterium]
MNLQIIKSLSGSPEFVLIPVAVYNALRERIEDELAGLDAVAEKSGEYVPFALEDYVDNPVSLARMKANMTQRELAVRLGVTQAYISKVEHQEKITPVLMAKVKSALGKQSISRRAKRK